MNFTNLLYQLSHASSSMVAPETILLPSDKQLYTVDLETRTINGPETLSIQSDHYAETVYFLVDRYYDHMDLAHTNCVVQYVSGTDSYVYAVPFCDITTYEGKIIIPWTISASATKNAGTIRYFIRFYEVAASIDENTQEIINSYFTYSLCTLTAKSTILKTLVSEEFEFKSEDEELGITVAVPERYFEIISTLAQMVDNSTVYWMEADLIANALPHEETPDEEND